MELVLVRHGEPEWVRDGFSVDDPPLTTRGHEQAERLADRLAGEHFDQIYVSPMTRARQTAAPLLARQESPNYDAGNDHRSPTYARSAQCISRASGAHGR